MLVVRNHSELKTEMFSECFFFGVYVSILMGYKSKTLNVTSLLNYLLEHHSPGIYIPSAILNMYIWCTVICMKMTGFSFFKSHANVATLWLMLVILTFLSHTEHICASMKLIITNNCQILLFHTRVFCQLLHKCLVITLKLQDKIIVYARRFHTVEQCWTIMDERSTSSI